MCERIYLLFVFNDVFTSEFCMCNSVLITHSPVKESTRLQWHDSFKSFKTPVQYTTIIGFAGILSKKSGLTVVRRLLSKGGRNCTRFIWHVHVYCFLALLKLGSSWNPRAKVFIEICLCWDISSSGPSVGASP